MPEKRRIELGDILAIRKPALNALLKSIRAAGFEPVGPRVRNDAIAYEPLEALEQLPKGYITEQAPGHFRLIRDDGAGYFDFIPGAQSWKQFLFPPRVELLKLKKTPQGWNPIVDLSDPVPMAFIGVRACELAAIQMHDRVFLRADYSDPIYRARRSKVLVVAVNCLHPAGTCFCASMSSGPRADEGFDLCLTELDDIFLLAVGSELGRSVVIDLPTEPASAFSLATADRALAQAAKQARSEVDPSQCETAILRNLDHPQWDDVASRCLSCGNCTLVCPTCFCWDVEDRTDLLGTQTTRERIWDSCFNPGYSSQAGGNTRPTIKSRYRQWLSHKFSTWKQQFGALGCVGCGRCVTWCPAAIDTRSEVAAMQRETDQ